MRYLASLGRGLFKRVADTSPLIISDPPSPSSPVASVGQSAGLLVDGNGSGTRRNPKFLDLLGDYLFVGSATVPSQMQRMLATEP